MVSVVVCFCLFNLTSAQETWNDYIQALSHVNVDETVFPQTSMLILLKHCRVLMGKQKDEQGSEVIQRRKWSVLSGGFRKEFIEEVK